MFYYQADEYFWPQKPEVETFIKKALYVLLTALCDFYMRVFLSPHLIIKNPPLDVPIW